MQRYVKKISSFILIAVFCIYSPIGIYAETNGFSINSVTENIDEGFLPKLNEGNYVKWIDRLDFTSDTYAADFYTKLENSISSCLTDPLLGEEYDEGCYGIFVNEFTGTGLLDISKMTSPQEVMSAITAQIQNNLNNNQIKAAVNATTVYYAFRADHPEVFWLNRKVNYSSICTASYLSDGSFVYSQKVYFVLKPKNAMELADGTYFEDIRSENYRTADAVNRGIKQIEAAVQKILSNAPEGDTYEKVQYFNKYLTKINDGNTIAANLSSGTASNDCWESISALTGSSGVNGPLCEGYARALKVLCDKSNIPCVLSTGESKVSANSNTELHMWNLIMAENGEWYGVDVTWNDPLAVDRANNTYIPSNGNEDYLFVSAREAVYNIEFEKSHVEQNIVITGLSINLTNSPKISEYPFTKFAYTDENGNTNTAYISHNVVLDGGTLTVRGAESIRYAKIEAAYPNSEIYCQTEGNINLVKTQNDTFEGIFKYIWKNAPDGAVLQARAVVAATVNGAEVILVSPSVTITNN